MGNFRNRGGGGGYRNSFKRRRSESFADPSLRAQDASLRPSKTDQRAQELSEDSMMGFAELPPGSRPRVGWLVNMVAATVEEPSSKRPVQAVDLFFISDDKLGDFRATIISRPYMYLGVLPEHIREAEIALRKKFGDQLADIHTVHLEDISAPNHLALDKGTPFLKVETRTNGDLFSIRQELRPIIVRNSERKQRSAALQNSMHSAAGALVDALDALTDMREFDVAPVNRLAIDRKINVGYWYRVTPSGDETAVNSAQDDYEHDLLQSYEDPDPDLNPRTANDFASAHLEKLDDIVERASPVVLAYDIECTKKPLKFPDAESGDQVMMISWMVDGKGYLGINRQVVSKDIDPFEYKPHEQYQGAFQIFNEPNEIALLQRFFAEVRLAAPRVFVTFNGDYFDWPFVEKRASLLGLDMGKEIGMRSNGEDRMSKETKGRAAIHMDVFHWVNRDSYLPQGSRGLKAVTRALLGFEPEEIPPEEMMTAAMERPDEMAKYSVSDAVCTYYLYMKYVHPFIFSLCNIIPLNPDDVLRRGSGTLCEMLLMCQAREKRIVAPNKYNGSAIGKLTEDGHVLESETYVGGHVEALRTGIYRSDLPLDFEVDLDTLEDLEKTLDDTLKFSITVEGNMAMDEVTNYDEVRSQIVKELHALRDKPRFSEVPLIYHLDVSAMYPNIILTNRLQPHAVVTPAQCAACDFNGMSECQRDMEWTWRGEYFPASRGEAEMIQRRAAQEERDLERQVAERMAEKESALEASEHGGRPNRNPMNGHSSKPPKPSTSGNGTIASFDDVEARRNVLFRKRLKDYCKTNYKKTQETRVTTKTATVCQRENPFYVDTVRAFRDRRYEYKALLKKQKKLRSAAKESGDPEAIKKTETLVVLYDSLQLAHKCILNSFYGYVMRKGARWYSMEMAGIVTNTGGLIIRRAREFIEKVGLPLELDTDGIWCVLPKSFPEEFSFKTKSGKDYSISYICSVFNADVAANFTNHQYQDLVDPDTFEYEQRSECSILFEVDGPYRAMVLPASLEEGKSIKKRYAVFNDDGSLAELKGFEIKRRGELKLIKEFQGEIFKRFLEGSSISDCYSHVGATCNKWLDILTTEGEGMTDEELLELLVEQNNMSKPLDEYLLANQKSCAITCASRMKEFLGSAIAKDKGLATMYVIAKKPDDVQVTARAIPVQIFEYPNEVTRTKLLKKWTKSYDLEGFELRQLLDWEYYKGRLANAVLKIVSIPAALQAIDNPVPRIPYPPWLVKKWRELKDKRKQRSLTSFFKVLPKGDKATASTFKSLKDAACNTDKMSLDDIEDVPIRKWTAAKVVHRKARAVVAKRKRENMEVGIVPKSKRHQQHHVVFRSRAQDPLDRMKETRDAMLRLFRQPRPDKRIDYAGWVRYAKCIWRAQRAARVQRYAKKRMLEIKGPSIPSDDEQEDIDEEKVDNGEETKLGGVSFAVRYGKPHRKAKRANHEVHLDYAPANFVRDLQAGGTGNFFSKKKVPLLGHGVLWQNVSISAIAGRPGEFRLWVLPIMKDGARFDCGQLHSIPLHVQRTLYVNARTSYLPEIPGVTCERVSGLSLPRSRPVQHLFRLDLDEEKFYKADKELASILNDATNIDGVFCTQASLEYELITTLGILCVPRKSISSKLSSQELLSRGLHLDDIVSKNPESVPYLRDSFSETSEPVLNQAFLYGSHATDGSSRAMYVVIAPAAKIVHVIAVTPGGRFSSNIKRTWNRVLKERKAQDQASNEGELEESEEMDDAGMENNTGIDPMFSLPSDCKFTTNGVRTREEAWAEIEAMLSDMRYNGSVAKKSRSTGLKTVLLAQWPVLDASTASKAMFASANGEKKSESKNNTSKSLEVCVPSTKSYPVVFLASNADDGNYAPVGWEPRALSTAFNRFADVGNWLPSQLELSRFAGIPLGNVSATDVHGQALDVLVGRELMNRDHILWASPGIQPDLGGIEEDDSVLQNEIPGVPEFMMPGSYRTVCIDTELSHLAIATILSSSHVNQVEGTDLAFDATTKTAARGANKDNNASGTEGTVGGKTAAPLDEMAASAPAFRVLKDLVVGWDKIASNSSRPATANTARGLLNHLYRWTRSETSILYDPAIARFIGWLIRKVFNQLVGELKNLGATIVFASMSRLILATPKTQTLDGLRYAGFLERTVKENPLFKHIGFEPLLGVYSGLLFVDRFNYGALPAPEEALVLSGEFSGDQDNKGTCYTSKDIPYARMMWDMARYMPTPVAVLWSQVVEEFIRRPMVQRLLVEEQEEAEVVENIAENPMNGIDDKNSRAVTRRRKKRTLRPRGDGFEEEVQTLTRSLTGQLLEKVHEIREKAPMLELPNVPTVLESSPKLRRNPALEFTRTLCHVMSLDPAATEEVSSMRRSLLRLLGVREFAKESQFIDPALPVLLQDVICSYCNAVVDLDIARDTQLWTSGESDADRRTSWACEYCGNLYDMRQIELDLVRMAQKLYTSYHVQDLTCRKCRMVKRENMGAHCPCSGAPYELSISQSSLRHQAHALRSVAEFHKFEFLLETVSWIADAVCVEQN